MKTAAILTGLIALLLLLSLVIGLKYAAIVFSVSCAGILMSVRRRWIPALVAGGIMAAVTFGVFDYLMAIVWPEPWLLAWLQGLI